MNIFRKGIRRFIHLLGKKELMSSKRTMRFLHLVELGRWPNLKNPKDINEKLMWMEFNTDTSQWSRLADKYGVREYVKLKGFGNILVPMIGVYDNFADIDFNALPMEFVIKSTNGSSQTIIVRDKTKLDPNKIGKNIGNWFKIRFGLSTGEVHYLKIKPRIIIEKILPLKNQDLPIDYKFYCFKGEVKACLVFSERNIQKEFYKINLVDPFTWKEIDNSIKPNYRGNLSNINKPSKLGEMISIARKLSEDFPFVRVDLYEIDSKIYFGEMTFTPAGCRTPYMTRQMLYKFGESLII